MKPPSEAESRLAQLPLDQADLAALNAVRACYDEDDPVPEGLADRIQFELTLDQLRTEVATLTRMDLVETGIRSTATEEVRTITFTSESLTTMVTITPGPKTTVRIDGWAAPAAGIRVEVQFAGRCSEETIADADGRFAFDSLPTGMARFALHLGNRDHDAIVVSPTIEL